MRGMSNTTVIILAGSVVLTLSFGIRSVFGVMLDPISDTFGWPREIFSLSMAISNIMWGVAQPFFGWIADRYGDRKAIWLGFACYLLGMIVTVLAQSPLMMHAGAGFLVGMGVSGTAFGLILSVVGRATPEEKRSQALALTAALGSLGQMVLPALSGFMVESLGWQTTLIYLTAGLIPMAFCIPLLKAQVPAANVSPSDDLATRELLARAFGHRSYVLLTLGFFVCGFHVAFLSAHLPAFVARVCAPFIGADGTLEGLSFELFGSEIGIETTALGLGALTLSVVGFANFVGTLIVGQLGARYPKPWILSAIYALRALVIFLFISFPITPATVLLFSISIGFLWLTTVPLTTGLVATMFGPKFMATLYGFVFLSHQVGSFIGIYLGGRVFDLYGNYDIIWYASIVLGIFSAIVHLPVRDRAWSAAPA